MVSLIGLAQTRVGEGGGGAFGGEVGKGGVGTERSVAFSLWDGD